MWLLCFFSSFTVNKIKRKTSQNGSVGSIQLQFRAVDRQGYKQVLRGAFLCSVRALEG